MRISDWSSDVCSSDLHAQRIEHDIDRRAVIHVRHVFDRHDLRDHALVAVTASHLVARLNAALHGQIDLDHLQHARRQLVTRLDLALLVFEALVELRTPVAPLPVGGRSEEHTSELQSLMRISYAVFCLHKKHHTQHLYKHPAPENPTPTRT